MMVRRLLGSVLRRPIYVAVPAACLLAFIGGAFVTEFKVFPYRQLLNNPFGYIHAMQERRAIEARAKAHAKKISAKRVGRVTIPATADSFDGYTFLTFDSGRPSTARLIDQQGKVLHEWHRDYRDIWRKSKRRNLSPESAIVWFAARLFPNGDIITIITSHGETPYGYGLVKLDKDSNVIWKLPDNFHHQFSISDDGHIFGLVHRWRIMEERPIAGAVSWPPRVLEDFIVEVSPEGKELSRVSLIDALAVSGFSELLLSSVAGNLGGKAWDRTHANDVEVLNAEFASHYPFAAPGMVLVSVRELDALVLVDMKLKRVVWARRGPWIRQHDPDLLSNGHVLLFDNCGLGGEGGGSRILELDLNLGAVPWSYQGSPEHPFRSYRCGGQQRLPNGNTLISEDEAGRIFEVTNDGRIVWEYRDAMIHGAVRVTKDWLQFTPSGVVKNKKNVAADRPAGERNF